MRPASVKRRRRYAAAAGLLLLGSGAWLGMAPAADSGKAPAPTPAIPAGQRVSTALAGPAVMIHAVRISGSLVARDEVAIGSALPGQRVATVHVDEGDQVAAGQILARLDSGALDAQVRQAEAGVARARAALAQQTALSAEADAVLLRIAPLGGSGAVSEQQIDERRAQAGSASGSLRAARAELAQARAQLADVRTQRAKAEIRAPAAGLISERGARAGALADADAPLFRLIRHGTIEFEGQAPEMDLPAIAPGSRVRVEVAGIAAPLDGQVRMIAPKVDPQTRQGRIRIALAPHAALKTGLYAKSSIETGRLIAAVTVPPSAVSFDTRGVASVMVIGHKASHAYAARRVIAPGRRSEEHIEVKAGLAAGKRVVAAASAFVRDGDEVRIAGALAGTDTDRMVR